jgi:hypothetical protein
MTRFFSKIGTVCALAAALALTVEAANTVWKPLTAGDWLEPTNWVSGLPDAGGNLLAYIDNGGTAVLTGSGESAGVTLGASAGKRGTARLEGAAAWLSNAVAVVSLGSSGTGVWVQAGGFLWSDKGFRLGYYAGSLGDLAVSNGLIVMYGDFTIGGNVGDGLVRQSGGTVELRTAGVNNGRFSCSSGDYELTGGRFVVTGYNFNVGTTAGKTGRVTVDGPDAVLDVRNAALVNGVGASIGNSAVGELAFRQGAVYFDAGVLVGNSHTGLILQTGGIAEFRAVTLGSAAGGSGEYRLEGGTLRVDKSAWPERSVIAGASGSGVFYFGTAGGAGDLQQKQAGCGMIVRQGAAGSGEFRGWSDDGVTNRFGLTGPLQNSGRIVADGYGVARALNMTGLASVATLIYSGPGETNGWFAVNRGKLMLPPVSVASSAANWGHSASNTEMNLINAVRWTFKGTTSGKVWGELLAADRADVPGPGALEAVSVHAFSGLAFTNGALSLRYDPSAAAVRGIPEDQLKLFRWNGSAWAELNASLNTSKKLIAVSDLNAMGLFAAGRRTLRAGSLLMIR